MSLDTRLFCRAAPIFIFFLMIRLVTPGPATAWPTSGELRKAIQEAARFEREERWEEARDMYLDLGRSYPTNRNILYGLDRVHRSIDDDGRYLRFLRENYRRYPGDVVLFRHYLDFSIRSGEVDKIEPDVRLFITSRKPTESVYRTLYSILLPMNLHDLTETVLLEGEKTLNDSSLFSRELSDLYHQTARYEESLEEALNLLTRNPESLSFVKKRIGSLWNVMAQSDIVRKIEEYGTRRERTVAILSLQSWLYIQLGDMRGALSVLKELSERDFEVGIAAMIDLAMACEAGDAFREGIETYRTLGSLDPSRKVTYDLEAARLLRLAGDPKKARRVYRSVLESNPDSPAKGDICLSLGEIALYDLHRPEEALDWLGRAVEETGDTERSIEARLTIVLALVYVGDFERAETEGERASMIDPPADVRPEVDYYRGVVKILDGRTDEGREVLERVSMRSGHLRANDALEALTWLEKDTSTDLAVARGLIERKFIARVEKSERAIDRLENLREIAGRTPLAPYVAFYQATILREAGRYGRAVELLDEIVTTWKNHRIAAQAQWEMADIYRRDLGEWSRAKTLLEQIILEYDDSVVAPRARRDLEELEAEEEQVL